MRAYTDANRNIVWCKHAHCLMPASTLFAGHNDDANVPEHSLATALSARDIQQEVESAAEHQQLQQQKDPDDPHDDRTEADSSSELKWREGLCGMSLLPLDMLQMPLTTLGSGQPCLVSLC